MAIMKDNDNVEYISATEKRIPLEGLATADPLKNTIPGPEEEGDVLIIWGFKIYLGAIQNLGHSKSIGNSKSMGNSKSIGNSDIQIQNLD